MDRVEHLLILLMEEAAEISQRASKALRFGLDETQPDQELTNEERIVQEVTDLTAVIELLKTEGVDLSCHDLAAIDFKKEKIERYLNYSVKCGTLKMPRLY